MKTIKQVEVTPVYVVTMPDYETFEEGKIYISEEYGCAIHRCLCGCGEKTVMGLQPEWKDGWEFEKKGEDGRIITFRPSIGNFQFPCKSHYIITNNKANFV